MDITTETCSKIKLWQTAKESVYNKDRDEIIVFNCKVVKSLIVNSKLEKCVTEPLCFFYSAY